MIPFFLFFFTVSAHTDTLPQLQTHAVGRTHACCRLCAAHTTQDTQLCQDESIILSYYAASDAGENCMPHPSSVFYFLLKINRQINKPEIYSHLRSCRGELAPADQDALWRFDVSAARRVDLVLNAVCLSFHYTICEEHSTTP